jgi:hypothetical protein
MSNIYDLQHLLFRSLSDASRRSLDDFNKTIYSDEDTVQKVSYNINSHGYRSVEFDKNNEILVLGCSQTYGSGMPDEFTWSSVFSNSINKKYSRIAIQGDSIGAQVYKAFKYFEEIGNPEIVVATFPLYRLEFVSVPAKFMASARSGNTEFERTAVGIAQFYEDNVIKFSKIPHDPEYVIPKEFVLFYNFMFIEMLEQYCESNNIKFIWSIYDSKEIEPYIQSMPKASKNYLKTSDCLTECSVLTQTEYCAKFLNHPLYDDAADYDFKKNLGHWGIHTHQHMAERFIEKYREITND